MVWKHIKQLKLRTDKFILLMLHVLITVLLIVDAQKL